jgi:hypothetical protein
MDKPQRKWLVRHAGDHGIYDCTDDELFDVVERGPYGLITIAAEHDRDTARLIAAAPDLVEALQNILLCPAILDELNGDSETNNAVAKARAALSKATGGRNG